jgi:protein SCO1
MNHAMRRMIPHLLLLLALGAVASAQQPVPATMEDIGVDERLNAELPLDTAFTDELGNRVTLRDCLMSGKPAVLQIGYFGCPMLCDLISQGMLRSMKDLDLQIGQDFSVIYISFDPRETQTDAYKKKKSYVEQYGRSGAAKGWHFLVGDKEPIKTITQAVGFKYKWVESSQQFSHPAVLTLLSPEGRVSRYLYGVEFPQRTVRLSLVEASQGKIGTTVDRVMMICFRYDASTGKYAFAALGMMRLGGGITVLVVAIVLMRLFLKERRARIAAQGEARQS